MSTCPGPIPSDFTSALIGAIMGHAYAEDLNFNKVSSLRCEQGK
jgi:hypothetical protein